MTDIVSKLVHFTRTAEPPETAKNVLQLSLLDWLAVAHSGRDEPVSQHIRAFGLEEGGRDSAHVFGQPKTRVAPRTAALVNGTISHALDYDDTHFAHIGHPSVAVLPAIMALAEANGITGTRLKHAALIGMEASVKVGVWLGRSHYQKGFHQTATAGTFGATLGACRLLGVSEEVTTNALALASSRAAGLKAQFGTMAKPLNAGLAASNGVECAMLAQLGVDGGRAAFDGSQGFGQTHFGEADNSSMEGLGTSWIITDVSHKFHACCHGLHATLEALRTLDLDREEVAHITIQTHPRWMTVCNQIKPKTGLGAKFSYGSVVALMLCGFDTSRLDTFSDLNAQSLEVQDLQNCLEVQANERVPETGAHIRVHLQDGSLRDARYDLKKTEDYCDREARVLAKSTILIGSTSTHALWSEIQGDCDPSKLFGLLARQCV